MTNTLIRGHKARIVSTFLTEIYTSVDANIELHDLGAAVVRDSGLHGTAVRDLDFYEKLVEKLEIQLVRVGGTIFQLVAFHNRGSFYCGEQLLQHQALLLHLVRLRLSAFSAFLRLDFRPSYPRTEVISLALQPFNFSHLRSVGLHQPQFLI